MSVHLGRPGEEAGIDDIAGLQKAAQKFEPRAFRVRVREQARERAARDQKQKEADERREAFLRDIQESQARRQTRARTA